MLRLWLCLIITSLSLSVSAFTDIRNSSDYAKLERFPSSYIVQYKQEQARDYRLILGGLEKINGALRPEKEQRIKGNLTQITYRIPESRTPAEAFEHFYSRIIEQGGKELFRCSGRDCGSSNQWANNIFGYFRLYGVDKSQSFASLEMGGSYLSLYSVRRGNKRVYLRLDILDSSDIQSAPQSADNFITEIKSDNEVSGLVESLEKNPELNIWLVAYDFDSGSRQEQITRSKLKAENFKNLIVGSGIDAERVFIHAAGSFSEDGEPQRGTRLIVYSENRVQ